jgi:DNA adenine methylase
MLTNNILIPPLKWVGGKRRLVPKLLEYWIPNQSLRLVEPFVGGMSVALGLSPQRALLNDANRHLINFYKHVQAGLTIDIQMENDRDFYLEKKNRFNQLIADNNSQTRESAQLWYYLNRTCYNGMSRFSGGSNGKVEKYNVPFGRFTTINYANDFLHLKRTLKFWEFTSADFSVLELDAGDLIYADPPYHKTFTKYCKDAFTWDDQVRLVTYLAAHPGKVIASNMATDEILDLYGSYGFKIETIKAWRSISCDGDRTPAIEMFATKGF